MAVRSVVRWYLSLFIAACEPPERPQTDATGEPSATPAIESTVTFTPAPGAYDAPIVVTLEAVPRIRARWSVADWEGNLLESGSGWLPRDVLISQPADIRVVAEMPSVAIRGGDASYDVVSRMPQRVPSLWGTLVGAIVAHPRFAGSTARVWAEPGGYETSVTLGEQPTWFQLSDLPPDTYRVLAQIQVEGMPLFVSPTYARLRPGRVVAAHIHADTASVTGRLAVPDHDRRPTGARIRLFAVRLEEGLDWEEQRLDRAPDASIDYAFSGLPRGRYRLVAVENPTSLTIFGPQVAKRFCCFEVSDPTVPVEVAPHEFGTRTLRGHVRVTPAAEERAFAYVRADATDADANARHVVSLYGDGQALQGSFELHPLDAAVYDVTVRFDDSPSGPRNDSIQRISVDLRDGDADVEFVLQR